MSDNLNIISSLDKAGKLSERRKRRVIYLAREREIIITPIDRIFSVYNT
jgi:hypothetical protein